MSGWGAVYNNTRMALHLQAQQMARLQEQAASGARVNRASDDPSDAYRILKLRAESEVLGEYGNNLEDVTRTLELAHNVLQDISTNLRTVRQKAEQGASGTYGRSSGRRSTPSWSR
jgi:flagellar hook-associated protein 3 FlgL